MPRHISSANESVMETRKAPLITLTHPFCLTELERRDRSDLHL